MNRNYITGFVVSIWCLAASAQTSPRYENYGLITTPPQIDATTFINGGVFDFTDVYDTNIINIIGYVQEPALGIVPYDTQNTLHYTNLPNASMVSGIGYNFFFITNGFINPTHSFDNRGVISGLILRANATNLVNKGLMSAPSGGLIELKGNNLDLSFGGIDAGDDSIGGIIIGTQNDVQTYYTGLGTNNGLSDDYQMPLNLQTLQLPNPRSPMHEVLDRRYGSIMGYLETFVRIPSSYSNNTNFTAIANEYQLNSSNLIREVIFINTNSPDTNLTIKAGFSGIGGGPSIVQFSMRNYNPVQGEEITNYIYFVDRMLGETNLAYYTNYMTDEIERPEPYYTYQSTYPYYYRLTNNVTYSNEFILSPQMASSVVTNSYIAWSGLVGSYGDRSVGGITSNFYGETGASLNPALFDPTNQSGRVEIEAGTLNLKNARIRAQSWVSINATNSINAQNVAIDAPVVKLDLTCTNSCLLISNLIPQSVKRLTGMISAWSGIWTNTIGGTTNATSGDTNEVTVTYHTLILDHNFQTTQPAGIYSLALHSTNIVVADRVNITENLMVDGKSFSLEGQLYGDGLENWNAQIAPITENLTNNGSLTIRSMGWFGADRTNAYSYFINSGTCSAAGLRIKSDTLVNDGLLEARNGTLEVTANSAKLDNGILQSGADVWLKGFDVKARNSIINAGTLFLNVTNRLADGGPGAMNEWTCSSGFRMLKTPESGSLLGTRLTTSARKYDFVSHQWSAKDKGATAAGFEDNAAIGRLIITGASPSYMTFSGAGTNNALYVDYLELRNYATNYASALNIDSNMKIYFAAANLPVEELDGKLDGRLRWVKDYAGPNSSTNVVLADGRIVTVNLGLRQSPTIDSDADGTPNAYDVMPFEGIVLKSVAVTNKPPMTAEVTWNAAAETVYRIDYATNMISPEWQFLKYFTNSAATNRVVTVEDNQIDDSRTRFYRVSYQP
ncbi:MAG: hypothetical protein K9N48_06240 [Verrucomicrobia bacterium]|nr:hypothetical protein [Verrucomicrobiota bacterium]MCF7709279.1 hypothetical protein [Verrucomicrobiota bacterium]